jgi:outer membrane lipoprotein carrier protein
LAKDRGVDVIDRLQDKFDDLKTLSARFVRKSYWRIMDQKSAIDGRLYVERPNRFRFETKGPTVVTDGEQVWNYTPANEQVLISDYNTVEKNKSPEKLLFDLILLGGYAESYAPVYMGEEKVDNKACHIVRIRLWIDKRMWVVRQVEYYDLHDNVTTFELSDLEIDKKMDADIFTFHIPKNVETIDLR